MKNFIGKDIIGTWKLTAWQYEDDNGDLADFFGDSPSGILMYDEFGYMNAQIMKSHRTMAASGTLMSGTQEEMSTAFLSYFAYYGTYEEAPPCEIVHTVMGSLTPAWVGNKQLRYAIIEGDCLTYSTPAISTKEHQIVHYISWKKIAGRGGL